MTRFNNSTIFNTILFLLIEHRRSFFSKLMLMFGCASLNAERRTPSSSASRCVRSHISGRYCDGMECVPITYKGLKMSFVWSSES